jgi:carbamoyltransferase
LNDYIKHREWFRPFALAVPEEDCDRYFECSQLGQSMNSLAWVRSEGRKLLDGFVLPGNLARLHVVRQSSNPQFWRLIKRFGERAPAPILVNTSFNLFGEPLVVKPRDAVRSYFCSGVDALMIDMFLLSKSALNHTAVSPHAVDEKQGLTTPLPSLL